MKDSITEIDREYVLDTVKEAISWFDANQNATKEEFEAKLRKVEFMCQPVMKELHQLPRCNTS